MAVLSYQDLTVWQRAMDLAVEVYGATTCFPPDERFGLTNQVRRASVSVPSNVAEGQGRGEGLEFHRFLRIAQGSLQEMETQLILAGRLNYLPPEPLDRLLDMAAEVGRLNRGLQKSIVRS